MDASDLRVFEAVARLGGMNRAAAELNTVQSNVTARVRQLEDKLGAALFDRHSRGVALTEAGRRLLPYAQQIKLLLDHREDLVAGFEIPDGGTVTLGDQVVGRPGWALPPEKRRIGMVFQSYALWPHMSVAENVAFALRVRKVSDGAGKEPVHHRCARSCGIRRAAGQRVRRAAGLHLG